MKLQLQSINFHYPNSDLQVLNDLDLALEKSQLIGILGSNGSGKSTLAKIVAGLLYPDSGDVLVSNKPLSNKWNRIGLLLQNPDEQIITGSMESELAWGLENLCVSSDEMKNRVQNTTETFELSEFADLPPENLSDGQKQLLALASVVIMEPDFLILDEPVAFLDSRWRKKIMRIVKVLRGKMGILWISTRSDEVMECDEVFILDNGRFITHGKPDKLFKDCNPADYGIVPLEI